MEPGVPTGFFCATVGNLLNGRGIFLVVLPGFQEVHIRQGSGKPDNYNEDGDEYIRACSYEFLKHGIAVLCG